MAVLAWLIIGGLVAPGVLQLRIETSTDSVLDRTGPEWAFYESSQKLFGGDEILTLLVVGNEPFDPRALEAVIRLSERFAGAEGVRRVDSLSTVPLVRASPDGDLLLDSGLAGGVPRDRRALDRLQRVVETDRVAPRALVSEDGTAFAVNVVLEQGAEKYYENLLEEVYQQIGGHVRWVSGVPVFRTEADSRTRSELAVFVPLTVAAVGLLLFVAFRSISAVVICLSVAGTGCWITAGVMGVVGVPITIATVLLPSILLALGSAYSMHLLSAGSGLSGAALLDALRTVALPVALSGLTTAIGFLSMSAVRIDAIRDVGAYGALGVLVVLACTLTAIPASLSLWPIPRREHRLRQWLRGDGPAALCRLVATRQRMLVIGWVSILMIVGAGVFGLQIETDVIDWFPRNDPIRRSYEEIRTRMSGISPMNVVIRADSERFVTEVEVVYAIDRLSKDLESMPEVGKAISISDLLRQIHGVFTGDSSWPLPEDTATIEQYLLLLEAKPYIRDLVVSDRSTANVLLRVDDNGSDALLRVKRKVDAKWAQYGPPGTEARATGIMYEFGRAEDEIARGQLVGLAIAVGAIGIILLAIFGDARIAVLTLLPNAIPVAMAFGLMGLVGVPLDAGTVILGSLALGVAVDDTVHVAEGYVLARSGGSVPEEALFAAFSRVLEPVVYTTLILACGFGILAVSDFSLTRNLGLLTAGVMILCLAADLLLLPVLLLCATSRRQGSKAH